MVDTAAFGLPAFNSDFYFYHKGDFFDCITVHWNQFFRPLDLYFLGKSIFECKF